MNARDILTLSVPVFVLAACQTTTDSNRRLAGLSPEAREIVAESQDANASAGEPKASLDASVQKYRTVTLTDDKAGKPRINCKRIRGAGTLFEKRSATPKKSGKRRDKTPRS